MRPQTSRPYSIRTTLRVEQLEPRDLPHALALTPLVEVSGPSPFLGHSIEVNDPAFGYSTEVEPYVAVDPTNPNHLVGSWIQDFARGIVATVSFNGGNTWQSVTLPGTTVAAGGIYPHSSNSWVTFSPDGSVYICLMGHDIPFRGTPNAILVTKSTDGGLTWGLPTTIATGLHNFNDKVTITADPYDSRYVYATWSLQTSSKLLPMFSRTADGGQAWEPARALFNPGGNNNIEGGQVVVLPDGTLVNMLTEELFTNTAGGERHKDFRITLIRSTDHGQTWQSVDDRVVVSDMRLLGDTRPEFRTTPNPDGGTPIRSIPYFFDLAVDPRSGNLYAVWPDARFGSGGYTGIAFSMSADGGLTWSSPIQVNQTPNSIPAGNRQAFLPSVAVNDDGVVAVTYYDFRNNTPVAGLPTDVWMVHAHPADGLTNPASWSSENRMTPTSFDMEAAPNVGEGYFLGDYQGLVAQGSHFGAFFSMPSSTDGSGVFYRDPLPADTTADAHGLGNLPDFGDATDRAGRPPAAPAGTGARPQTQFLTFEQLEERTVPSINLAEAELNNTPATANVVPRMLQAEVNISGTVDAPGDRDWFRFDLQAGDVFGASVSGQGSLNPALRLVDSAGTLLFANDDAMKWGQTQLPSESPLPRAIRNTDAEAYYVMSTAGTYYLEVSASGEGRTGSYELDTMVARPGMEAKPIGARQILFLDFDGANVDLRMYDTKQVGGIRHLSPLSSFLSAWGLTAADEDAIIDAVLARVTDNLSTYLQANGENDNFGIEILNSRDHADRFGIDPLVSRVVVGGTVKEAHLTDGNAAIAPDLDVGNFKTDDEALVTLDFVAGGLAFPNHTADQVIDFIAIGIATLVTHEAGHLFGMFHSSSPTGTDPGLIGLSDHEILSCLGISFGPDGMFQTEDDFELRFITDEYDLESDFRGRNDTLNTIAFGLSMGTQPAAPQATANGAATRVKTLDAHSTTTQLPEAISRWQVDGVATSLLLDRRRITILGAWTY